MTDSRDIEMGIVKTSVASSQGLWTNAARIRVELDPMDEGQAQTMQALAGAVGMRVVQYGMLVEGQPYHAYFSPMPGEEDTAPKDVTQLGSAFEAAGIDRGRLAITGGKTQEQHTLRVSPKKSQKHTL